jgi:hypothetical protein
MGSRQIFETGSTAVVAVVAVIMETHADDLDQRARDPADHGAGPGAG